jgi:predicted amidohydrolase YtcJ
MSVRSQAAQPLLLVADRVVTLDPRVPSARAVLCEGGRVRWVGDDPGEAPQPTSGPARRVELDGVTLQPAFVDAHVHLTATGLGLGGLDLADCRSLADCLAAVAAVADVLPGRVVWGSGWDDFGWPEGRPPDAAELRQAANGRPVFLLRADGHSCVVDRVSLETAPFARADGVDRDAEGRPTGVLRRDASHLARRWFFAELEERQLEDARRLVTEHAASLGYASVHEMGGPDLLGAADFDAWREGSWPIEVVPYWGDTDLDFVAARGLRQIGGSLLLDGTLGSRSAALDEPYADGLGCGHLYRDTAELVDFTVEAVHRRIQPAFHCIGDRAVRQAVEVLEKTAASVGRKALRALRPRLDLCELVPAELTPTMAALGCVAVVGPSFDRIWGGDEGLYAARLGVARAATMNPFRPLDEAGVALAFGSDAGACPMDPWPMVDAAVRHRHTPFALPRSRALEAAILGGRHAARQDDAGRIRAGQRADLAAFDDERRCVLTLRDGQAVHGSVEA